MKSPEERAREIAQAPGLLINCWPTEPCRIDAELLQGLIAAALRKAQSERDEVSKRRLVDAVVVAQTEAYERAAQVADLAADGLDKYEESGEVFALRSIATAIRNLKDTSPS